MAATNIYKFAKYDVKKLIDKQRLMVLAHEALETNIEKLNRKEMQKQSADQNDMMDESSDQDYDTTNNSANSFEVSAVAPESSSQRTAFREAALECYKRKRNYDVYEMEMDHFLKDTEELITGKPQYRLLKSEGNTEVGLLQIAKAARPPKQLKESDKAFHQIQALLYAGKSKYSYCHYVQFNQKKKYFMCTKVVLENSWKDKVVSNVRKYFEYYDAIWTKAQMQFQDSDTQ